MTDRPWRLTLDQPATYQITVQGRLGAEWAHNFECLTLAIDSTRPGAPATTLTATLADQAALHGMLRALYDLGLPLLAVRCIETYC
jgi:hypothetical protein